MRTVDHVKIATNEPRPRARLPKVKELIKEFDFLMVELRSVNDCDPPRVTRRGSFGQYCRKSEATFGDIAHRPAVAVPAKQDAARHVDRRKVALVKRSS